MKKVDIKPVYFQRIVVYHHYHHKQVFQNIIGVMVVLNNIQEQGMELNDISNAILNWQL